MERPLSETKRQRRIRIQRQRAKQKNKNFWQRKKAAEIAAGNSFKKRKQSLTDELSQHQALREIRVENQQCKLKHIDRRLRGYYRFGSDATASLDEENQTIMLENEQSEALMQADVQHHETSQFIMMGNEVIDLTDHDECELIGCMTEYDDLEGHERELDREFDRLSA